MSRNALVAMLALLGGLQGQATVDPSRQGAQTEPAAVRLARRDEGYTSRCELFVGEESKWSHDLPQLLQWDYDASGALASVGTATVSFGDQAWPVLTLTVVSPRGELVVLEAMQQGHNFWPHGNTYPVVAGVHVFPRVAVFRVWPGPGLGEQWWLFDSNTGARLLSIDPTRGLESAVGAKSVTILDIRALKDASLFAVQAATSDESMKTQLAGTKDFGGTICALVDLDGEVTWKRRSPIGSYFTGSLSVEPSERGGYRVALDWKAGALVRHDVLTVDANEQGVWTPEDSKWE